MSERVEARILTLISDPERSPYGNPIPGLDELGWPTAPAVAGGESVGEALSRGEGHAQIVRIGEPAQVEPESLELLLSNGIVPGARVELVAEDTRIRVRASGHAALSLPEEVAAHLFVTSVP